jgi:hypothetical protein
MLLDFLRGLTLDREYITQQVNLSEVVREKIFRK